MREDRKRRWDRDNMLRSLRPPGNDGHLSPSEVEEMRARRAAGQTVGQIADEMGVRYPTVSRHTKDIAARRAA